MFLRASKSSTFLVGIQKRWKSLLAFMGAKRLYCRAVIYLKAVIPTPIEGFFGDALSDTFPSNSFLLRRYWLLSGLIDFWSAVNLRGG